VYSNGADTGPAAHPGKHWFFEAPRPAARGHQSLAEPPRRASLTKGLWATARTPVAEEPASTRSAVVHPEASVQPAVAAIQAPSAKRRPVFRPLDALGSRSHADRHGVSDPSAAKTAPSIGWTLTAPGERTPTSDFAPPRVVSPRRTDAIAPRPNQDEPRSPGKIVSSPRAAERRDHGASSGRAALTTQSEAPATRRASNFASPPAVASRDGSRRFAHSPTDDRWPTLPPSTFTPPAAVEAPSPRWDQLAREQEEGRWSV
jgi:hypothetical protein